ncbi:MAG: hypothetical protein BZY75_06415 [SAR202 cluster bacterium Io17-Chloro-G7]|nr:MAG: hypothetical protein BZY75_06415 [SAR202 cluster bacterium Io17-Chloro-G7]
MFNGSKSNQNGTSHVRNVELLPGETIDHIFSPELGLTQNPSDNGQLLVATNHRVLAFCRNEGRNETYIVPVSELQGIALKARTRTSASIAQGIVLALGAILLYLGVAYWITGRVEGPSIAVINMDVVPFLILLIAVASVGMVARYYFATEDGSVTFQGNNWSFAFPYRGKRAGQELQLVINSVFAARFSPNGHDAFLWED